MAAHFEPPPIPVPDGTPILLRDLIHDRTGLYFDAERTDLIIEKLRDRVVSRGCRSYLDYFYILKYDENAAEEWLRLMDVFSVQETYFWREHSQIDALVREIIPAWFRERTEPLRIWSAACATGEEPCSIAMAIAEAGLDHLPIEILASDASEVALQRARAGMYRERSFRVLAPALREKYFTRAGDLWRLDPRIASRVQYSRANLVSPAEVTPLAGVSVIFCRNVFIYFSPDAIRRTLQLFARHMREPACLFVGSSESLLKLTDDFELKELGDAFVYQRKPLI